MILHSTRLYSLCLLLLLLTSGNLLAQSLSLFNVDATNFPEITGNLFATDAHGDVITGLSGSDLLITEDGNQVTGTITIDCPTPTGPTPMSVVLVVDRSGSMIVPLPNRETPLELIRVGATAFLQSLLFTPPTAVAITGFNEHSYIISDFRTSAPPLTAALQTIIPNGGTQFDPAFLDPITGAIELLKSRPATTRKVVIFITDGEPNTPPSTQQIINAANGENAHVYTITIGTGMTSDLQRIAAETGGNSFGDISNSGDLVSILRSIALQSRGAGPCHVRWQSQSPCAGDAATRLVSVSIPSLGLQGGSTYTIPPGKQISIQSSVKTLWFGAEAFPSRPEKTLQITPRNGAITLLGATISDPDHFKVTSWGGSPPPFTLNIGDVRTITIQFAPTDTMGYGAVLSFDGDPCPSNNVTLAGGDRIPQTGRTPLVLQSPVGGEVLDGCDSVTIRWGGVPPEQPVRIQYSDGTPAWKPIADSATGYEYRWFPPEPGDNYRIRISTDATEQHIVFTLAGGGDSLSDDIFATDAYLALPWGLDVWNDTLYLAEAGGRNQVRIVDLFSTFISTAAGTGAPGNGGDGGPATRARFNNPSDVLVTADRIFIADRDNFKIRVVDKQTGVVTTFAGTGAIGFSKDGTRMDTGTIGAPTSLATDGTYLYFSELSSVTDTTNHRIRRIDLQTKVISTVAGGGTFYDSDGALASKAILLTPFGLVLRDNYVYFTERDAARVRRVDLTSGIITTIAGTGRPGSSGDGGPAIAADLNSPTDILFIDNEMYIAESTNGHRVRVVNMKTGTISTFAGTGSRGFMGDSGAARSALFNEPTSLVQWGDLVLISDHGNGRIRAVTLRLADGLDSSRSPFSVVAPRLAINSAIADAHVDMGAISLGGVKDSILTALICNTGTAPLTIDSAAISGANGNDFKIVGGLSNVPILPGECRSVGIEFHPLKAGARSASVLFYGSCTFPDTLILSGTGLPECGIASIELVDFGDILFGKSAPDTIVEKSFCNTGGSPISGNVRLVAPGGTFTIISGSGPFTLAPNECLKLVLHFTPSDLGRTMGIIDYGIPTQCGSAQTLLSGRGLQPQQLQAEGIDITTSTCPDNTFDTAVTVRNIGQVPLEITNITLPFNNEGFSITSPIPTSTSPLVILPGAEEKIGIHFAPVSAGVKNGTLQFTSNDSRTTINVELRGKRDSLRLVAAATQVVAAHNPAATYPRDTVIQLRNTGDRSMTITGGIPTGGDAAFFVIPSTQFPLTIDAGTTGDIAVHIQQPTEDRAYQTDIDVVFQPSCNLPGIIVRMIHAGTQPVFATQPLDFPPLLCDDMVRIDTTIVVSNPGGSDLRITDLSLLNNPEGNFILNTGAPIVIPPGGSANISLSFMPVSEGIKTATLRFTTNTENGFEEVLLRGERHRVRFNLSKRLLTFDPAPGKPKTDQILLNNTGTIPITWSLSSIAGPFTVLSIVPQSAGPNESSTMTIRYDGPAEGSPDDSILISELICGTNAALQLRTVDGNAIVQAWLPHDSAWFNTRVGIPLRYKMIDGVVPDPLDTFRTTIRFIGTTFFFESLTAGEVVDTKWNPETEEMAITIQGTFGESRGDTLTKLVATGLLARETFTPLTIQDFGWSRPSIQTTTIDGSFRVLGTCLDAGIDLDVKEPRVERIRPNPASSQTVVDVLLDDWAWMSGELIDPTGKSQELFPATYVDAGLYQITIDVAKLQAGLYLLRLNTPHGSTEMPMLVVH